MLILMADAVNLMMRSDGMSRKEQNDAIVKTISEINDRVDGTSDRIWRMSVTLLLSDISKSLAVIADKMEDEVTE